MAESIITVDDYGVRRTVGGIVERVAWDDLAEVAVVTTADGPFAEDVYIVLVGSGTAGCAVPLSAPESAAVLERVQRLPGFDYVQGIRAMTCAVEGQFVCWRR